MKVVVMEFMSLDGVVQAPGGPAEDTSGGFRHGGWSLKFFDPEVMGPFIDEISQRSEALLQGRRTYQVSAEAWPERSGGFADWINSTQKYVVSDTLTATDVASWNPTTIIRGADLVEQVSALRNRPGGGLERACRLSRQREAREPVVHRQRYERQARAPVRVQGQSRAPRFLGDLVRSL